MLLLLHPREEITASLEAAGIAGFRYINMVTVMQDVQYHADDIQSLANPTPFFVPPTVSTVPGGWLNPIDPDLSGQAIIRRRHL